MCGHLYHLLVTDHALLREIPDTFNKALVREGSPRLDVDRARTQHAEYRSHIENAGYQTTLLPADPNHPDCVFVEDPAVVVGRTALIARSGEKSRRGEEGPVAETLGRYLDIVSMSAPATLDGGDVFILNETIYVGQSERTNEGGIDQLAAVGAMFGLAVVPVGLSGVLHLKSAVLPIDAETVVVTPGTVNESMLAYLRILDEDDTERHQFSALPLSRSEFAKNHGSRCGIGTRCDSNRCLRNPGSGWRAHLYVGAVLRGPMKIRNG